MRIWARARSSRVGPPSGASRFTSTPSAHGIPEYSILPSTWHLYIVCAYADPVARKQPNSSASLIIDVPFVFAGRFAADKDSHGHVGPRLSRLAPRPQMAEQLPCRAASNPAEFAAHR